MAFNGQRVLPAVKKMKEFEQVLNSQYEFMVMLDLHITQLESVLNYAKDHKKKLLLHLDRISGLKSDKYAAEYVCQALKPAGVISTRGEVLKVAKKNGNISDSAPVFARYDRP